MRPSLRYSFSGSGLALTKGSTATERPTAALACGASGSVVVSAATNSATLANRSFGILGERAGERLLDARRRVGPQGAQRPRRLRDLPGHRGARARRPERRLARQHLVDDAGQAVHVARRVEVRLSRGLLGAHVLGRAEGEADLRDGDGLAGAAAGAGDAEVRQHREAVGDQDVLRLHVPVHVAVAVGEVEPRARLLRDPQRVLEREPPFLLQPVPERAAGDVGRDVVEEPAASPESMSGTMCGWARRAAIPISRRKRSASIEAASSGRRTLIATGRACLRSCGQVDRGHAAAADLAAEGVAVREDGRETRNRVRHARRIQAAGSRFQMSCPTARTAVVTSLKTRGAGPVVESLRLVWPLEAVNW